MVFVSAIWIRGSWSMRLRMMCGMGLTVSLMLVVVMLVWEVWVVMLRLIAVLPIYFFIWGLFNQFSSHLYIHRLALCKIMIVLFNLFIVDLSLRCHQIIWRLSSTSLLLWKSFLSICILNHLRIDANSHFFNLILFVITLSSIVWSLLLRKWLLLFSLLCVYLRLFCFWSFAFSLRSLLNCLRWLYRSFLILYIIF